MKNDQNGFGFIEGLLVVIVVTLVGISGYYIYNANKAADKSSDKRDASTAANNMEQESKPSESDSWKLVESGKKAFKLRIPDGWTVNNDPENDNILAIKKTDIMTYQKGTPAVVTTNIIGGSDNLYRFTVFAADQKNVSSDNQKQEKIVTNSGLAGEKSVYIQTEDLEGLGNLGKGGKSYTYQFEKNNKYVIARYLVVAGETDNVEIVEKAIKTLEL